jgi:hypothetical protein
LTGLVLRGKITTSPNMPPGDGAASRYRVFPKGVCPPDVGLMGVYRGIVSFIIPQRIGIMIVGALPKPFTGRRH